MCTKLCQKPDVRMFEGLQGNVCFTCAGYLQLLKTKSTMHLNDTVDDGLLDSDTAQEAH